MNLRAVVIAGTLAFGTVVPAAPAVAASPAGAPAHSARSDGGLTQRTRWLLAMVIVDLALAAWWRGWLNPGGGRRGLALGDAPEDQPDETPPRAGRPPRLR